MNHKILSHIVKKQLLDNYHFNKVFDQNPEGTKYVKIKKQ